MMKSCDSGSLPFIGDSTKFLEGAKHFGLSKNNDSADYFEKHIVQSFLDKIGVGIEVPNYPQFRDMSEMILSLIDGLEKLKNGYIETKIPFLKTSNGLPEVDLLIRTGDELRLSNFLIWQTAYSEYYFTEVLWPDFGKEDIEKALLAYSQRKRRFGGD